MENQQRTYWKEFSPLWWGEIKIWFGWTDLMSTFIRSGIQVLAVLIVFLAGGSAESFFESAAIQLVIYIILFIFLGTILLVTYHRASSKLYLNQKNIQSEQFQIINTKDVEIQKLNEELSKSVEQLDLWVDHGRHIYPNQGPEEFVMCLTVNVISGETQKILDLEAHLASIDWLTEKGSNVWHHLPFVRNNRLEWEDGSYQVELKPGINELKQLKIAILNCTTREFRFAHEDLPRKFPYHQGNATYSIRIRFSGKSEGNPIYKSHEYETEFICVPEESKLEFLQKAENNQDPAT